MIIRPFTLFSCISIKLLFAFYCENNASLQLVFECYTREKKEGI